MSGTSQSIGSGLKQLAQTHESIKGIVSQIYATEELEKDFRAWKFVFYWVWATVVTFLAVVGLCGWHNFYFIGVCLALEIITMSAGGLFGYSRVSIMETVMLERYLLLSSWSFWRLIHLLFAFSIDKITKSQRAVQNFRFRRAENGRRRPG